jgi:hypothetical protein
MLDLVILIDHLPPGVLPPGRFVSPDDGSAPVFWLSDQPVAPRIWSQFRSGHDEWKLWPLLLRSDKCGEPDRPWEIDVSPAEMAPAGQHDVADRMQNCWRDYTEWVDEDTESLSEQERTAITAPFGRDWPGLGPAIAPQGSPEQFADGYAEYLHDDATRLALVGVERSSDVLWATGWSGPANYGASGDFAAVVRTWEDRYGVRVVGLGTDTLELSLAAPPESIEQALAVAAEHFAFCPDSVWQGSYKNLEEYAASLVGQNCWSFWWD